MAESTTHDTLYLEAIARFREVFEQARALDLKNPDAVTLATANAQGRVSVRMVLLKSVDETGFTFFTNLNSVKGRDINANSSVALCCYWEALDIQIRVEGVAELVSDEVSDRYWQSRPRESRIGAWASSQSEPLESREILEQRFAEFDERYPGEDVPRPAHWRGVRIVPSRMEFWRAMPARLHERVSYELKDGRWIRLLLHP